MGPKQRAHGRAAVFWIAAVVFTHAACGGSASRAAEPAPGDEPGAANEPAAPAASSVGAEPTSAPGPTLPADSASAADPASVADPASAADSEAGDVAARAATEFEAVAGNACACPDQECAEGVFEDFKNLVRRYRDTTADDEASRRTSRAVEQLLNCLMERGITRERVWGFLQQV